jgi:hypothetical protein
LYVIYDKKIALSISPPPSSLFCHLSACFITRGLILRSLLKSAHPFLFWL